jgi:hypothetical protein
LEGDGADGIYFLSFFNTETEAEKFTRVVEKIR